MPLPLIRSRCAALLALCLLAAAPALAETVLVSNEKDNTITALDGATLRVLRTVPVGERPRGIVLSHDKRHLYICAGDSDRIDVIDAETLIVTRTIPSGADPEALNVIPSGNTIYVANENDSMVTAIDRASGKALAEIAVGVDLLDLDRIAHQMIRERGAESCYIDYHPSFGAMPFGKVLCTSVNDAVLHGLPHAYKIKDGDVVSVDFAASVDGWVADSALTVIAGTQDPEDVRLDLLTPSQTHSVCAYKGRASYLSSDLDGGTDIAWTYPDPLDDALRVRDHIAFWSERAAVTVDGVRVVGGMPDAV